MNALKLKLAATALIVGAVLVSGGASAAFSMKVVQGTSCAAAVAPIPITTTGGSVTLSICVSATGANEAVCGATYPIISTNAAATAAAVSVASRATVSPFTNVTDIATFPFVVNATPVALSSAVPPSGVQAGGTGTDFKVAEVALTIPSGLPGSTTFNYQIDPAGDIQTRDPVTTNCNDLAGSQGSISTGTPAFSLVTPATPSTAVFTVSPATVNVTEAGPTANVTVTCTGAFASNQSLPVSLAFTTTNAAGNFTTTASPLSFAACGGATQTITVTPRVEDSTVQGPVSGSIALTAPAAGVATLGSPSSVTVNVADNDTPPVFGLVKAGACAEPTTSCTFGIVRESGVTNTSTVGFTITGTATRGTDYTLNDTNCGGAVIAGNSVSHTQAAPSGTFTIAVCPIDDTAVEGAETVIMTLNTGAGYTLGAVATQTQSIADDDSPQVVTVAVNGPVSEAGGVLTYTFTRSGGSAAAQAATLSVNTTAPATSSRYSTTCGASITFAASTSTATCTVTAIDNVAVDGNVTATVAVAAPTVAGAYTVGSPSSATGTINDDDVAVNAVAGNTGSATSAGIVEGGIARFSVSCPTLTSAFTVNYSITPAVPATGDAFVGGGATGSVTCPVGAAGLVAVPTTVQTLDDTVIGNTRTYTMTISVPTAQPAPAATVIGNAVAVVSVADNDRPLVIPTMGAIGLGLMSLMLAGLAAFQRRRRA